MDQLSENDFSWERKKEISQQNKEIRREMKEKSDLTKKNEKKQDKPDQHKMKKKQMIKRKA